MKYLILLMWTTTSWAMSCEENLGRLPEVRQAIQRLEMLEQLAVAGIGTADIKPIKDSLLGYEDLLQRDEPLDANDMRYLDLALQAADDLRLAARHLPSDTPRPHGTHGDMYDRRFGWNPEQP